MAFRKLLSNYWTPEALGTAVYSLPASAGALILVETIFMTTFSIKVVCNKRFEDFSNLMDACASALASAQGELLYGMRSRRGWSSRL